MHIVNQELAPQHYKITIQLSVDDYIPDVQKKLNKISQSAQIKGFRKGKAPLSVVKKLYSSEVLYETINEKISKALFEYIDENKYQTIGSPLESNDAPIPPFSLTKPNDIELSFEIGTIPQYEVKGTEKEDVYHSYKVIIDDSTIEEAIDNILIQNGEIKEAEGPVMEEDNITIKYSAKINGETKEGNFQVLYSSISDEKIKEELNGKDVGYVFSFDVYELEGKSEDFVKKYYLSNDSEEDVAIDDPIFKGEIHTISRKVKAELNESFFSKLPEEINDEEKLKMAVKKNIDYENDQVAFQILSNTFFDALMEKNQLEMPKGFIKKMIANNNEIDIEDSEVDKIINSLKWDSIKQQLVDKYGTVVSEKDILAYFKDQIRSYFGQGTQGLEPFIENYALSMMKDEEKVRKAQNELTLSSIMFSMSKEVTVEYEEVTEPQFAEIIKANQKESQTEGEIVSEHE